MELLVLDRNTWNHLTVCKQMSSGSILRIYQRIISLQIMGKQDLAWNNHQRLICH